MHVLERNLMALCLQYQRTCHWLSDMTFRLDFQTPFITCIWPVYKFWLSIRVGRREFGPKSPKTCLQPPARVYHIPMPEACTFLHPPTWIVNIIHNYVDLISKIFKINQKLNKFGFNYVRESQGQWITIISYLKWIKISDLIYHMSNLTSIYLLNSFTITAERIE